MIRGIQVNTSKNISIVKAAEDMKRGMCVMYDPATKTASKATASAGFYFVDVAPNYDGVNAAVSPDDTAFEDIKAGDLVLLIPPYTKERYATNQINMASVTAGSKLAAAAGLLVNDTDGTLAVFESAYNDPSFTDMQIVQIV